MNKEEKEKAVIEIWKKHLEAWERAISADFFKLLGIFGGIAYFIFKLLKNDDIFVFFITAYFLFAYLAYQRNQDMKYVDDMYYDFVKSVLEGTIETYKPYKRNLWEKHFYYKRRYN